MLGWYQRGLMVTYFNLHWPDSERLMGDSESEIKREHKACPLTSEHLDGSRRVSSLALKLKHNLRSETMIWCWVEGLVIHERLLEGFKQQGFTGYRTRPATVRFRDGQLSNEYQEFTVTGWAGVATAESGVRVSKSCPVCHWKKYTGITNYEKLIDWSQWTGDDFFIVWPLPRFMLITERVAQWILSRDVKSFSLKGLDDFDRPVGASGFTVGRLSNFMPEDLAIEYGRPHGLE